MQNFTELHSVTEDAFIAAVIVTAFGLALVIAAVIVNAWQWWRRRGLMAEYVETERRR